MPKQNDKDQWKGGLVIRHDVDPVLTQQQEAFVAAYVANGGNAVQAGKTAGFADGNSQLSSHKVREAIELKRDMDIKTGGATMAWQVMQSLLTDPAAPPQVRFQAARWTLEASGHGLSAIAAAIHLGNRNKKDQHEMSVSELVELVDKGRKQLESMKQVANELKSVEDAIILPPNTPNHE
jgi:hypothetical protein